MNFFLPISIGFAWVFLTMALALWGMKKFSIRLNRSMQEAQTEQRLDQQKLELNLKSLGEGLVHQQQLLFAQKKTEEVERELSRQQEQHRVLTEHLFALQQQIEGHLRQQLQPTIEHLRSLTQITEQKLQQIATQVDQRLEEGFSRTQATFVDMIQRLALIDEAQKHIMRLSKEVVSLQSLLSDKRARGAFGEVQLEQLVRDLIPEPYYQLQHTLSNRNRVDCLLILPKPTGPVSIDAKFPLETYRKLLATPDPRDIKGLEQQFRQDMKKHIHDISQKYIIPGETSDGAVMFIPAESIFLEIHNRYPEIVSESQKHRVWLTSPSTMMAVLTTARSVLKDAATREQVSLIRDQLHALSKDFERFQTQMDQLCRHIDRAQEDVHKVNRSAKKITKRLNHLENLQVEEQGEEEIVEE